MGSRRRNRKRQNNNLSKCKVLPPELDLPPELWTEVLARLPAKTLIRFRSVCRAWCSKIDAPEFCLMHLSLYKNNMDKNRLLVMEYSKGYRTLQARLRDKFKISTDLLQKKISENVEVLGYCNGLVLLLLNCGMYYQIKLWNPSIQKSIVLPRCPGVRQTKAPIVGFVPSSNEYKVAAFSFSVEKLSVSISIYSVSDHLWREKTAMIDFPVIFVQSMGYGKIYDYYIFDKWKIYYSHGAVHWLVSDKKQPNKQSDEYEPEPTHVLSFDFGVEGFNYVKLPVVEDPEMVMHMFNLGESLAVFGVSKQRTCIWVMTENLNNNPWSLWFTGDSNLDTYTLFSTKSWSHKVLYPGFFSTRRLYKKLFYDESTSTFILVYNKYDEPRSYNIITHEIRRLRKSIPGLRIHFVDTYMESLALCSECEDPTLLY